MGRQMNYIAHRPSLARTYAPGPAEAVRIPSRIGMAVIVVFVAVFGVWGGTAPLSGGAHATGTIAPDGSVRTVQHLEGGIVERIFVRNGDHVEPGTSLLALKRVAPESEVAALLDRRRARAAEASRLEAELKGSGEIVFPPELAADPDAATAMSAERRILAARDAMLDARRRVLGQRSEQLEEQIRGYEAQVESSTTRLALVQEEIDDKTVLLKQGLTPKVELLELQRAAAEIAGFRGEYVASIARTRQEIGETEIELLALDAERIEEVTQRAAAVRGELAEIDQSLAARRDVLDRTVLTAPVAGLVNNLRIKTEGGVIGAGSAVLDIVPTEEKLVIDAQVASTDIDLVKIGLSAYVHLTALSSRKVPTVTGAVTEVSADSLVYRDGQEPHYLVRVEVDRSELDRAGVEKLAVGMPAEVIIVARERTMVEYLMQPFTDALRRAGREISARTPLGAVRAPPGKLAPARRSGGAIRRRRACGSQYTKRLKRRRQSNRVAINNMRNWWETLHRS